MSIILPSWLPQTLLIKIGIYAGIALGLFVWWRAHEAKIAEQYTIVGIKQGAALMEGTYKKQWDEALTVIKEQQVKDEENYQQMSHNVEVAVGNTNVALAELRKIKGITLTLDERQKAYVEARAIPPSELDGALLLLSRELDTILANQPKQPDR
jgi:hypothetical protein